MLRRFLLFAGMSLCGFSQANALSCLGWANPQAAIEAHDVIVDAEVIYTGPILTSINADGFNFQWAAILQVSETIKGNPDPQIIVYEGYYAAFPPEGFEGVIFLSEEDGTVWLDGCHPIMSRQDFDGWIEEAENAPECPEGDNGHRSAADYIVNEWDDPDEPVLPWTCNPDK